jgi:hypothetical protein
MKRLVMVLLLGALAIGCRDQRMATAPDASALPGSISAAISDGTHADGNPDFFFLPPLQPPPQRSPNFDRGKFNPNLRPVVKICDGRDLTDKGECAVPLKKNGQPVVFNAVRGWDRLPDWVDPEQYHALWRTRDYDLVVGNPYRILVKVGSALLGFLDIVPANRALGALRITAGGEDVGWLDDWVVPIRFRIEQGALCAGHTDRANCVEAPAITGTSDTVIKLPSQHAAVAVPAGAIAPGDTVTIVIEQVPPNPLTGECLPTDLAQSRGCYHFSSEPALYHFASPVQMEACVDPNINGVPLDTARLLLYKYNPTEGLQALPKVTPTHIDCTNFTLGSAEPAPTNLAASVLRGLGQWAARLVSPPPLYATVFGTPPKGLGGSGGSFSDVGGAVPLVPPGIVSWWPAEGNAFDLYGGNNGVFQTQNGGSVTYAPGIIGTGFQFSGIAWVVAPNVTVLDTMQRLSVETWVKLNELNSHDERFLTIAPERVVLRHDAGNGQSQLHFYMNFGTRTDLSLEHIRVDHALRTGCFEHVVGTYDGNAMRLYLNGVQVGEHPFTGTVALGSHDQVEINSGSAPTQGVIDETRVFNRALPPDTIAAIYAAADPAKKCAPPAPQAPVLLSVPPDAVVGQTGLWAVASGGSGTGAFSYASSTAAVCTVDGSSGAIAALSAGTCTLTATKAADVDYLAATSAAQSFTVAPAVPGLLVDCPPAPGGGGDQLSRGFYVQSFAGTFVDSVILAFSASEAATQDITLVLREDSYIGRLVGQSTVSVSVPGGVYTMNRAAFPFGSPVSAAGKLLAFYLIGVEGPTVYWFYDTGPCPGTGCNPGGYACNVIETEDTSPPLSVARRSGVFVRIFGH